MPRKDFGLRGLDDVVGRGDVEPERLNHGAVGLVLRGGDQGLGLFPLPFPAPANDLSERRRNPAKPALNKSCLRSQQIWVFFTSGPLSFRRRDLLDHNFDVRPFEIAHLRAKIGFCSCLIILLLLLLFLLLLFDIVWEGEGAQKTHRRRRRRRWGNWRRRNLLLLQGFISSPENVWKKWFILTL